MTAHLLAHDLRHTVSAQARIGEAVLRSMARPFAVGGTPLDHAL